MSNENVTDEIKEHVTDSNVWVRLVFMVIFAMLYWVAEIVLAIVVLFQFLSVLFTGQKNARVLTLGAQLSTYAYQIFRFLTYNSEVQPFPMGDWPSDAELTETSASKTKAAGTKEGEASEKAAAAAKAPARKRAPAGKKAPASKAKAASAAEEADKPAE
ncbi:MAG TPA: DUF4389 domain-containing protein [Mariprofundaceae bacterium]|nr:DUF4389 domain-containing protein [Mariprofundaceae bacterium]